VLVLGPRSRVVLAGAAFASFAASFVATPLVARSAGDLAAPSMPSATPAAVIATRAALVPRRDPFAVDPQQNAPAPPAVALPAIPASLGPLPPNAGAPPPPFALSAQPARVTAVVTGVHPFALVDDGGASRIVTLHDRIAGESIVAITPLGVQLERGRLLNVNPVSSAPHAVSETPDR
jgi:hypothetical protein